MKTILNLTQHSATSAQTADGLVDLTELDAADIRSLLDFKTLPSREEIEKRAKDIAALAYGILEEESERRGEEIRTVMIGGAPYLMGPLERALESLRISAVYAFSERRSVDIQQPDGSVRKVAEFAHLGWIPAAFTN